MPCASDCLSVDFKHACHAAKAISLTMCRSPASFAGMQDGNVGLVKLVIEGQARRQIQKLTQTYLTLRWAANGAHVVAFHAMHVHAAACFGPLHDHGQPFHATPRPMPAHATPCQTMPCHALTCHAMSCRPHIMSCHAMPRHVTPCHATQRHAAPCHVTPCQPAHHALSCHAICYPCILTQHGCCVTNTLRQPAGLFLASLRNACCIHPAAAWRTLHSRLAWPRRRQQRRLCCA